MCPLYKLMQNVYIYKVVVSVCLFVCLFVCPIITQLNPWTDLPQICIGELGSMSWSWISTALTFNQLVKSSILELDNKTKNYYNYNEAECPNSQYKLVSTNFYFLSKLSESVAVNRRKRKGRRREKMIRWRIKSE